MKWFTLLLIPVSTVFGHAKYYYYLPAIEKQHAPSMYTTPKSRVINGSDVQVALPFETPDFRVEEPPFIRYHHKFRNEEERPYRDKPWTFGCCCTTVFKRLQVLAGCAVITSKHALTTATSTELILRTRRHFISMYKILGLWYDTHQDVWNSSFYNEPVRIHYHPEYQRPKGVNRSHPLPATFDLAVWTMKHNFHGAAYICERGGSHWYEFGSSYPSPRELAYIVGFQFMKAFHRVIMPWFKYAVRTRKHYQPCPKTEWGWFHCVRGNWAKLGMDSGGTMYRNLENVGWRYNGLIGMNAVSMRLRSLDMVHYFTVLNTHKVLNFLYASYTGRLKYEYLDKRYEDTTSRSPVMHTQYTVDQELSVGSQYYWKQDLPTY